MTTVTLQAKHLPDVVLLLAIERHKSSGNPDAPWAWETLSAIYPEKVIYAKYEKFVERGWLDYGVSMRTGWLTPAGMEALMHALGGP